MTAPTHAHILVVDDVEASRYVTASWLRRHGHQVSEAGTGTAALARLHSDEYHGDIEVVVLDVNLPDISGLDVCERIKSDPRTEALPVIHVSATAIEPVNRVDGLTRGADAYLTEPVDPAVLAATVTAVLRYYRARMMAVRLAERLTRLTAATLAINGATRFDDLVASMASGASTIFDAPAAALVAVAGGRVLAAGAPGPGAPVRLATAPEELRQRLANAPLGETGAVIRPVDKAIWPDPDAEIAVVARAKATGPAVCVAVPAAALANDSDRDLLLQWGQAIAIAAESLRLYTEEHRLALTLQRSLLPAGLPTHPQITMATRYLPAAENAEVGGDFYDVTEVDGRFLVAIGDVCGHSIKAALIMGEIRYALRAYAIQGDDPVTILDRLDALLRHFHPASDYTTLCLLLIDPATDTASIANAGHLPPLFVDPHGARYLDVEGPMLGLGLPRPPATEVTLSAGTTVLLMTDGLVERRDEPLDDRMEQLRTSVSHEGNLEELCDLLLARFGTDRADDIALLALRYDSPIQPSVS
ncbi:MAG TPA: SpoIIE family protein phosphatase [Pseudonocardiaceae bacterium]|jgi:CheY-like chemotaxis protein|nr:SpoIIE family protein phosphatase [Pseudonocardiaceae bacterium]